MVTPLGPRSPPHESVAFVCFLGPSEGAGEDLFSVSPQFVDGRRFPVLPLCVTVSVQTSLFYKDSSHMGMGAHPIQGDFILANYICNHSISK